MYSGMREAKKVLRLATGQVPWEPHETAPILVSALLDEIIAALDEQRREVWKACAEFWCTGYEHKQKKCRLPIGRGRACNVDDCPGVEG